MPSRRAAREQALKMLFQADVGGMSFEEVLSAWRAAHGDEPDEFTKRLVKGTLEHLAELDSLIAQYSRSWSLTQMAAVDRNLIRMALFEILHCDDIPTAVAINEAVELAKKYSTEKSGRFINGVLGEIVRGLGKG